MKKITLLGVTAFLCMYLAAQEKPIKPLTIGDTIPDDLVLTNVYNYPVSEIRLSDLKGKLVILDFWSTWCGACISLFPHLQEMQELFKDSIQIILVNTQSRRSKDDTSKISDVLSKVKRRTGKTITLPVIYDNVLLDQYFPCNTLPHEVWLDSKRIVKAITPAEEITIKNIRFLLNGIATDMHMKQDQLNFDASKPLFIENNGGGGSQMKFRSMITGYIEGLTGSGVWQNDGKITGLYMFNQSLLSLVKAAYSQEIIYANNRIFIEPPIDSILTIPAESTRYNYLYCYELVIPPTEENSVKTFMKHDLERYFNIQVTKSTRTLKCLVLKQSQVQTTLPVSAKQELDLEPGTLKKYIHNYPLSFVTQLLNNYCPLPIIDETQLQRPVAINLPFDISNIPELKKAFETIGLCLEEEERELEVIVICNISPSSNHTVQN